MKRGVSTVPFGRNNATIRTRNGLLGRFIYALFYVMFKTRTAAMLTSDKFNMISTAELRLKSGAVRVLTASKTSTEYF